MCEIRAWDVCVCMSDVSIEGFRMYVCICEMCEMKAWDISVCMSDV
jgi:hypothetical protein